MVRLSISEFKSTFLAVLERVRLTGEPILITRHGQPIAEVIRPFVDIALYLDSAALNELQYFPNADGSKPQLVLYVSRALAMRPGSSCAQSMMGVSSRSFTAQTDPNSRARLSRILHPIGT